MGHGVTLGQGTLMTSTTADSTAAHACVDANWLSAQWYVYAEVRVFCMC